VIFSHVLYQLSYLGTLLVVGPLHSSWGPQRDSSRPFPGGRIPYYIKAHAVHDSACSAGERREAVSQLPNPYGAPIPLENAKRVAVPAVAEARRNNWSMAVAIVDGAGELVYFERADGTQAASPTIAIEKARSAARFKRPTKVLQDSLAAGGEGLRILKLDGAVPIEGGLPLVMEGKIVGAIGVSGGTSQQDGQCAQVGADVLN
jgi:glc operon protein GlcG